MVRRDQELGLGRLERRDCSGRNVKFAPESVDVCLRVVEASKLHEMIASGRVGTVCTDHEVEGHFNLWEAVHGV